MDPQFQELAKEITAGVTTSVTESVTKAVTEAVTKAVTVSVEERLTSHFRDVKEHIDKFENRAEYRIKKHIDEFENRAEQRMKMHFENMEERVKLAAEGYGATLEGIQRELGEMNRRFDTKFGDHDVVLTDHSKRITKLERR